MELAELMALRPVPGAGLLLTVTGRCPLHCAHCSTDATMASPEPDPAQLLRFVDSFRPDAHPSVLMLTGGEPLLRPALSAELAAAARESGTRTALLTGAFFARDTRRGTVTVPREIRRAIASVDHFSVSLDTHHEREVPRRNAFAVVREVLDTGTAVSFHVTGTGPTDPYLADVTAAIRAAFADRVPVLVNSVRRVGRAASWATASHAAASEPPADPSSARPCAMAAWPVVAADGAVLACCNQSVVDRRPTPTHLQAGHIAHDDWPTVAARIRTAPALRMIRAVGPVHMLHRFGPGAEARPGTGCGAEPGALSRAGEPSAGTGAGPGPESGAVSRAGAGSMVGTELVRPGTGPGTASAAESGAAAGAASAAAEPSAGSGAGPGTGAELPRPGVESPLSYCGTCRALGAHPGVLSAVERAASGPAGALLDAYVAGRQVEAGPVELVRRHGCAPYAELVALPGTPR